nr:DUF3298 domain-containing protein [uncultured Eisenbergiella sp.]
MRKPEDGKKVYDNIEIPEELKDVVNGAIRSMDKEKSLKKHRSRNTVKIFRYCGTAAAALLVCMTIGLNTNEVFAKEMSELPIIGSLARVLTIRSYHEKDEGHDITVNVPKIQLEETQTDNTDTQKETFVGDINQEIQSIVDNYVAEAKQKFAEYKEAFFATGGTEEEWGNRDIAVNVDYEVKYQQGNILSMVLTTDEAWVAAYGVRYYYNLDLSGDRQLTLQDLLGDNYVEIANESILRQMKERDAADEKAVYWGIGKAAEDNMVEGFRSVDENTKFYINKDGNPVVCFEKYEVAPGYMGFQEFEIEKPAE